MCNLFIKFSVIPDKCKIVKLKPRYKRGNKTDRKNYISISLVSVVSEKVIHDQTMDVVTKKKHFIIISIRFSKVSHHRFLRLVFTR